MKPQFKFPGYIQEKNYILIGRTKTQDYYARLDSGSYEFKKQEVLVIDGINDYYSLWLENDIAVLEILAKALKIKKLSMLK
jgi:hypothetical protein